MDEEKFNQLKNNINKSGLSSIICCYKENDKYIIISGNHRYKACLELGYKSMSILYTEKENIQKDELLALQISHNNIHGKENKTILKSIFDEIESIEYKEFSGIDHNEIQENKSDSKTSRINMSKD